MNLKKKFFFVTKKVFFKKNKVKSSIKSGINFTGRKTVRSRAFINKKKKRTIDYFLNFWNVRGFIFNFEYDPNRNGLISLVLYLNGITSYNLSLEKFSIGYSIINTNIKSLITYGSNTYLKNIPKKTKICNIETICLKGAKLSRSSGSYAKIIAKNKKHCKVLFKNKNKKIMKSICTATIGSILSFNFFVNKKKKAGTNRIKGFKSKVRGVAMNPIDHPHGGGEGKKSKKSNPMSIWGKPNARKWRKKKVSL